MAITTFRAAAGAGAIEQEAEDRQRLHGVHAEEVDDAEVAAGGGPVDERQAGAAVGRGHGVAVVGDDHEARASWRSRTATRPAACPTGSRRAAAACRGAGSRGTASSPCVLMVMVMPMTAKIAASNGAGDVEVRGGAARRLHDDQHDLDRHRRRDGPSHQAALRRLGLRSRA